MEENKKLNEILVMNKIQSDQGIKKERTKEELKSDNQKTKRGIDKKL